MTATLAAAALLLGACTRSDDLHEPMPDLGNFFLGHNVVVASKMKRGPFSREATPEEWETSLTGAIEQRFGRYDGDHYYHLGVSVEGYILAVSGVPILLSPKSGLILYVTVWDDAQGVKLNEEPHELVVFESFSGDTFVGSGLTRTKEEQMEVLSRNAAKMIEDFLLENRDWFGEKMPQGTAPIPQAPAVTGWTINETATASASGTAPDLPIFEPSPAE